MLLLLSACLGCILCVVMNFCIAETCLTPLRSLHFKRTHAAAYYHHERSSAVDRLDNLPSELHAGVTGKEGRVVWSSKAVETREADNIAHQQHIFWAGHNKQAEGQRACSSKRSCSGPEELAARRKRACGKAGTE